MCSGQSSIFFLGPRILGYKGDTSTETSQYVKLPATKTNIQEHQNPLYNLAWLSIRTRLLLQSMSNSPLASTVSGRYTRMILETSDDVRYYIIGTSTYNSIHFPGHVVPHVSVLTHTGTLNRVITFYAVPK